MCGGFSWSCIGVCGRCSHSPFASLYGMMVLLVSFVLLYMCYVFGWSLFRVVMYAWRCSWSCIGVMIAIRSALCFFVCAGWFASFVCFVLLRLMHLVCFVLSYMRGGYLGHVLVCVIAVRYVICLFVGAG